MLQVDNKNQTNELENNNVKLINLVPCPQISSALSNFTIINFLLHYNIKCKNINIIWLYYAREIHQIKK